MPASRLRLCLGLLHLCLPLAAHAQDDQEVLELEVGAQQTVPATGVDSYSEGSPGVVSVRLTKDASAFVIVGQRPGTTSLLFLMEDGRQVQRRIVVRAPGLARAAAQQALAPVVARDNVRLDFYFVQWSRDARYDVGIGWPGSVAPTASVSLDVATGTITEATAVVTNQALPRLDLAQAGGYAKLRRQAAVITANGTRASFSGGGELNVPIAGALSTGVRAITYGSQIEVLPTYDNKSGRIELVIHADVSDLASDGGTGIPGRTTSTLDTVVNLELGQSVALAGLVARTESGGQGGLPVLSQIPILGGLFGSIHHQEHDVENIVFIVPTVADAVTQADRARVHEALRQYEEFAGDTDDATVIRTFLDPAGPR